MNGNTPRVKKVWCAVDCGVVINPLSAKNQIEGGVDFTEIAKEHSQCPSGQKGGALGEFGPGQMVKEFDDVVFSAELNKTHGPVQTQFGYHLIEITNREN